MVGTGGTDTLVTAGTSLNLSETALSGIEVLKAGTATATTFTVDQADLVTGGSVVGTGGTDTLVAAGTSLDLTATTLSSIEVLKAGSTEDTTLTVAQADLAANGSVIGSSGSDTLVLTGTTVNLSNTTVSGIENIDASAVSGDAKLVSGTGDQTITTAIGATTVIYSHLDDIGNAGDTIVDFSSGDKIQISGTEWGLVTSDLWGAGSGTTHAYLEIDGSVLKYINGSNTRTIATTTGHNLSQSDILVQSVEKTATGATLDITRETTPVDVLKGYTSATTFIANRNNLSDYASILGSTGVDTLVMNSPNADLSKMTFSSLEVLKVGATSANNVTLTDAEVSGLVSVIGNNSIDTLIAAGPTLSLTTTTLSGIEVLKAGTSIDTTFTVNQADLAANGSVVGNDGTDTLVISGTSLSLIATTLSSIEVLKAGTATATTFTVDQTDLANGVVSVVGNTGIDTLATSGTTLDLSTTTLSSVEILKAGSAATTFTVDQGDLAENGSVVGSGGVDTLTTAGATLDLSATTLSSVEILKAGSIATTFTVDQVDLAANGSVVGSGGVDTIVINGGSLSLTATTLSSIEVLKAGTSGDTTFTVDQGDLATGGSVVGGAGRDTLAINGASLDLSATKLSSVEILKAGTAVATIVTVDQDDLVSGGSVIGGAGRDTLAISGASLDLRNTTLSGIEVLKAGSAATTTFIVDTADLIAGSSVIGTGNSADALVINGTSLDLSAITLSGIEILAAGTTGDTTFTVDSTDLATGGSVIGNIGTDTLALNGTALGLGGTTLSGIEVIKLTSNAANTLTLAQSALTGVNSVVGGNGIDTLVASGGSLDLSTVTLSGIEILKAAGATNFTVGQSTLSGTQTVIGSTGTDTLTVMSGSVDLSGTTLSGIEVIQAGTTAATSFLLTQSVLSAGGSVIGTAAIDTVVAVGNSLDLSRTTLSGIEVIRAGTAAPTTLTVAQSNLSGQTTIIGARGSDTLVVAGNSLDLTATTVSSIETIKASSASATLFKVDQADLATNGSVVGNSGIDTLWVKSAAIDLHATTLSSIEVIQAGTNLATTITVDQADLATGGNVIGTGQTDTLIAAEDSLSLTTTTLSGIEILKAGSSAATTFTVDQADLATNGSVVGNNDTVDTLVINGTTLSLTATTLSGIEVLKAGTAGATTFTLNQADLDSGVVSVIGGAGADTLVVTDQIVDLHSVALTSVEIIKAGVNSTTFALAQDALVTRGSVVGTGGLDEITFGSATLDLSGTTLSSIETVSITKTDGAQLTVSQANLASITSIKGNDGTDTLATSGTSLDLRNTTLSGIEVLKAGSTASTTFTLSQNEAESITSILGNTGIDTLVVASASVNLSGTTLSSIEVVKSTATTATIFTIGETTLSSGSTVVGGIGLDTLLAAGDTLNLSGTVLSSVEILKAGTATATTFTVDQADLATGGSVIGHNGTDTLVINGTSLNLTATTLSGIEVIQAGTNTATTFTVDQADLASGVVSLIGTTGIDTLVTAGTSLDLRATTLSGIEVLKAGSTSATTFTVNTADLAVGGSVIGSNGIDTLVTSDDVLSLSGTTLSSIENVNANSINYAVRSDLTDGGSSGAVIVGGTAGNNTLTVSGSGSAVLFGGAGDDRYMIANNRFGSVVIADAAGSADSLDIGYVSLSYDSISRSSDNTDLVLSFGSGKSITIADQYAGKGVETLMDLYQDYTIQTGLTGEAGANNLIVGLNGETNTIDLSSGTGNNLLYGGNGDDSITGGSGNDHLAGGVGNNVLEGGNGNDILDGGVGTNTLWGGAGTDTLTGGSGVTVFRYDTKSEGGDIITDFQSGTDKIQVLNANFGEFGEGSLDASHLVIGAGAVASGSAAQFLFDTNSGVLSFDADGTGEGTATTIATFTGVRSITSGDILVVSRYGIQG
ncbi:calcium-binding protein [Magnetospirillum fulvum]|uniref:calcium-binding protein n=1 Tax=Magnetospirillum fulvum TaxID=1082 RepID=UPI0003FED85D|nr:calcium-binding protein [Magnetospirillum fulvum]